VLRVLPVGAIPPRAGARVTSPSVADASVWRSRGAPAQPAHAADCFAREIIAILTVVVVRSRRLMGNPLGRTLSVPHPDKRKGNQSFFGSIIS